MSEVKVGQTLVSAVERCGRGDHSAWTPVLAEARRVALDLARWRYRLNWDDAEDAAQIVQIRVSERLAQLRDPAAFPVWLRCLAQRAVLDCVRAKKPILSLDDATVSALEFEAAPGTSDAYEGILLRTDLSRALDSLPELYREPIRLNILEGLPQDEVAHLLGRPRSTVASQVARGLGRLQRVLSPGLAMNS